MEVARIEPAGFYIDHFPGSMEVAALFRPHVKYDHGLSFGGSVPHTREALTGTLARFQRLTLHRRMLSSLAARR